MIRVARNENPLLIYSKPFLFFEWKLVKSDLRKRILRSSEFNLGGAEHSFLRIEVDRRGQIYFILHNPKPLGIGYYNLTIFDKNNSCIGSISKSTNFTSLNEVDLFELDFTRVPITTEYPIMVSCTAKSSNNEIFSSLNVTLEKRRDEISSDLMKVLKEGLNTDIVLTTAEENIKVHKIILQARSPVFYKMFSHDSIEAAENAISISDIRASTLKNLMIFLYTGRMEKCNFNEAMELYYAADKYEVMSLRDDCRKELLRNLDVNNACSLFTLANHHNDEDLRNEVIQLISVNFTSIVNTESINDMSKDDIILLMRLCVPGIMKQ